MAFNWKFWNKKQTPNEMITQPKRGWSYSGGQTVSEDTAMKVSAYYRGLIYISTQIAKLPWDVKDSENKILDQDPIYYLLNLQPNPETSAMVFKMWLIQQAIHSGNGYAEIERDGLGRVRHLWPIDTSRVELVRSASGQLAYKVSGGSVGAKDVFLQPRDMFHVRNFHTKDGILGQGLVAYANETLGISLGADRMASNLFANNGTPSGVLEVEGILGDDAFERIKKSWDEKHGGRKTGGVAVLEEGAKFKAVTMQPDVMQFLESRQFNVLEIARFLGVPPTKLFDVKGATFANMENANLEVATDTLDAWAKNLEIEADIKLLNGRFAGRRTELDLYAVFRGDMSTRATYFGKMMQAAALTPNEIRKMEGKAPYSDGDRFFLAVNNFSPMDRVDEIIDSQISKNEPKPTEPAKDSQNELDQEVINFLRKK